MTGSVLDAVAEARAAGLLRFVDSGPAWAWDGDVGVACSGPHKDRAHIAVGSAWIDQFGWPPSRGHEVGEPPVPMSVDDAALALAEWHPQNDPWRVSWASALAFLPEAPPTDPRRMWGWLRGRFAMGDTAVELASKTAHLDADAFGGRVLRVAHGDLANGRPFLLPCGPVADGLTIPAWLDFVCERGWRRVGIAGSAATGKTTLARKLADAWRARGVPARTVSADTMTWPARFRYDVVRGVRRPRVWGPGLYDDGSLAQSIDEVPAEEALAVEGCFVGLDPRVRGRLDAVVVAVRDDIGRVVARARRDAARPLDIVTDCAAKVFHEDWDGIAPLLAGADAVVVVND